MKKIVKVVIPAALLSCAFTTSHAATSDGKSFSVSAGWLHIMPQGKKQGVTGNSSLLGADYSPNAGFEIKNADTAALLFDYYVNDNVALELVAGVPPKMEIDGKGVILKNNVFVNAGKGLDLSSLGDVGKVKAYTPALLGKYQFGTIDSKFRPFVGAGIMYAHFSDFKLGSNVNSSLNSQIAGGQLGMNISKVKIDDAIAPVATLGADYNFNKDWFMTASVTYAHLKTRAKLDIATGAGTTAVQGESDIEINPIATYLGIGYRF
ncbi:OmpW/AlkL family protein [Acinetobacter sp. MD2(2019)]|uniref:OmpW/AlkL family protein n=1 Tax=Acinetobacter sp. MD2(2019) TaxID=2605273 RepID=UPI002D1F756A|nr:OmpW family outer membrane protein [Acinetobacter sp. MD2(2019)]MEB3753394.1 OmpW family protein [Acinetobacter sp. MD2(2019)]